MAQFPEVSPFFSNYNVSQMPIESEAVQQMQSFDKNRTGLFESNIDLDYQQFNNETANNPPEKVKTVLTDILTTGNNFMKWLIKTQLQHLENDLVLQSLFKQQELEKNNNLELQMANENLSFERENAIAASEALVSKIKNTWEVCNYLLNHHKRLLYFKKVEVDELKNNFNMEMEKCSNDIEHLFRFCNSIIENHRKEITCLKSKAQEEHQHRISEVTDANSTYEIDDAISKKEISLYKTENDRNSHLMLEDQELTKNKEEEALKFKEDLENVNDSSYSFASKNMLLENEIISSKSKESGIEETLQSLLTQRESFENQSIVLEEELTAISNEVMDLTEELNTIKEKAYNLEVNVDEKRTKQETSEKTKKELLEQKLNCENELLIAKEEMEDIKNKEMVASEEVMELNLTLETNRSEYKSLNNENEADMSQLRNVLAGVLSELNLKASESKEHIKKKGDILHEFEESDREKKRLESEIEIIKTALSEELRKIKALNKFMEEEQGKAEELSQSLILRQKEVETTKDDLENIMKKSSSYKEEMLSVITQIKQEVTDVKEKQKITVSECNEKRQGIMKYLDECRNDSMKKSNQIEAEIDVEKKENANLKEKLNGIYTEKMSVERDSSTQVKLLESKIRQLQDDLDNVIIKPSKWRKSQIPLNKPPSTQASPQNQAFMKPPPIKNIGLSQRKMRKDFVESDSDQSSVDFNDFIKRLNSEMPTAVNESSKKRKRSFRYSSQPSMMEQKEIMQDPYSERDQYVSSKKHMSTKSKKKTEFEPLDLLSTL